MDVGTEAIFSFLNSEENNLICADLRRLHVDPVKQGIFIMRRWAVKALLAKQSQVGGKGTATLNRSILRWLETCQSCGVAPPQELIDAIARQLKVESGIPNDRHKRKQHENALIACALYPELSEKRLARLCGVSRPTIAQWKKILRSAHWSRGSGISLQG